MTDQNETNIININQSTNPLQNETMNNFVPKQNYENNVTNTLEEKPFKYVEDLEEEIHDDAYFEEEVKKSNLVFDEKNISAFKLYWHLSEKYEVFLLIVGTICSLGAGVAAPLMCYLFGDMANDFSQANVDENQVDLLERLMECKDAQEAYALGYATPGGKDAAWSYSIVYTIANEMFDKNSLNLLSLHDQA
jgi:hypothetical protein